MLGTSGLGPFTGTGDMFPSSDNYSQSWMENVFLPFSSADLCYVFKQRWSMIVFQTKMAGSCVCCGCLSEINYL